MKLKLDENLGSRGAELLRKGDHDVGTVPEQNLCSVSDKELIESCRSKGQCLVTLDLDFGNPLIFRPEEYFGIAVLRLPPRPTPADLSVTIETLIGGLTHYDIEGKLWIVQRGRIREYNPDENVGF